MTAAPIENWKSFHMALIDQIIGAESGGDANARNPNSSASGLGQFIDSTWLSTLRSARPDLVEGKSDADLLSLKSDPQLSREMTEAYAAQNQAILSKNGVPVTPGTTYLAHFAGPQGAVSVLQADPNAPVSTVLTPGAMKANPFLQGMSVADLQAWADRKMGGKTASQPTSAPPAAAMPQTGAPFSLAPPQAPIFSPQAAPQQQQSQGSVFAEMPAEQMAQLPPIMAPPRRSPDISKLRAALGNRGFIFGRG